MVTWDHWEHSAYAWVVICRNVKIHRLVNVNAGHKIPLAETDAFRLHLLSTALSRFGAMPAGMSTYTGPMRS